VAPPASPAPRPARARRSACRGAPARRAPIPSRRTPPGPPPAPPWRWCPGAAGSAPGPRPGGPSPRDAGVEGAPGPRRGVAQLFLDAQQLVVLRGALAAGDRAGLDLARVDRDGDIGDEGGLGLPRGAQAAEAVAASL